MFHTTVRKIRVHASCSTFDRRPSHSASSPPPVLHMPHQVSRSMVQQNIRRWMVSASQTHLVLLVPSKPLQLPNSNRFSICSTVPQQVQASLFCATCSPPTPPIPLNLPAPVAQRAAPQYVPLGSSEGQVWLAQQGQKYGVKQFYGDAWSAPGYMKTNGDESNGGALCGSPGATTCSTGDWRQAYANYLVQYAKDYQAAGVPFTAYWRFNEPNLTTSYSSMVMNPTQTADFIAVLGPTVKAAGLNTKIVCCDGEGWDTAQSYATGITSNATANSYTSVISSHGYTADPNSALDWHWHQTHLADGMVKVRYLGSYLG